MAIHIYFTLLQKFQQAGIQTEDFIHVEYIHKHEDEVARKQHLSTGRSDVAKLDRKVKGREKRLFWHGGGVELPAVAEGGKVEGERRKVVLGSPTYLWRANPTSSEERSAGREKWGGGETGQRPFSLKI
ncbi:hypothetical protein NPIL_597211 [Nephila pilipes]|uniref:Uncharacterized protein n=1 Tax=Nephila pilipes TaxID=299642 RepID=A0A8X6Q5X6_NEPPI|nr:hypothetical protein NPIL_597211 [Nephila pilipes]